jgi:hypothetical protein
MQLTTNELTAIMRFIDAAIRANGLTAARDGLPIAIKIDTEIQARRLASQQPPADSADQGK